MFEIIIVKVSVFCCCLACISQRILSVLTVRFSCYLQLKTLIRTESLSHINMIRIGNKANRARDLNYFYYIVFSFS